MNTVRWFTVAPDPRVQLGGSSRGKGKHLWWPGILVLPLEVEVRRRAPHPTNHASPSAAILAPADSNTPELSALARVLTPRLLVADPADERLVRFPLLAPVAALVTSVRLVMRATARTHGKNVSHREDVLNATLDALRLGEHRLTAERILRRDHPAHLHVDAWTESRAPAAPEEIVPRALRCGFGLFARNAHGDLLEVNARTRRAITPRVLFSLTGEDPL